MKKMNPLFRVISLILALVLAAGPMAPVSAATPAAWTPGDTTEILWVSTADAEADHEALSEQVRLFASSLAEKVTGDALPIHYGAAELASDHDIVLVLDSALEIAAQGYRIDISGNSVTISAADADGLFYGCNDLIKQLLVSGEVTAKDEAPDVLERAVSLDNGRKYYSVEWIKEFIRELSWSNMNALVLHFSEEMGVGIESLRYPWLAGRDGTLCVQAEVATDGRYLTQAEVAEIVAYAKLYHVDIIPSLDSPGHMNYIVKMFNAQCAEADFSFTYDGRTYTAEAGSEIGNYYHYNGKTAIVQGSRNKAYSRGIDISDEVAVAFTRSLIEEYASFFAGLGCTKFDIGGDELLGWGSAVVSTSVAPRWQQLDHWQTYARNRARDEGLANWSDAVAYDAFLYYMNDLCDLVSGLGYTSVRMWNDDILRTYDTGWTGVVELNTDIGIWYWDSDSNSAQNNVHTYLDNGYNVYNILSDYNYYVLNDSYLSGNRSSFAQAYADEIYNEWTPFTFDPANSTLGQDGNTALGDSNIRGGAFAIWCDNPTLKTEAEVMTETLPLIRSNAAKSWDALANETVDYDNFAAALVLTGNAPTGTVSAGDVCRCGNPAALAAAVAESDSVVSTRYTAASYAAYRAAVEAGRTLLENTKAAQAALDAALAEIIAAHAGLTEIEVSEDVSCMLGGAFRSTRVYAGKSAVLNIATVKDVEIVGFQIYDDQGDQMTLTRCTESTKQADRDVFCLMFKVTAADRGQRTYTVRAILSDGTLSADSMEFTLEVR